MTNYEREFEALKPFLKKGILDKGAKWRKDLPEEKKRELEPYLELRRRVFNSKNPLVREWVKENYYRVGKGPRGQQMRIRRMKKAGDYISGSRVGHEMVALMKKEEKRLEELLRRKF